MRRYIFNGDVRSLPAKQYDVVIVGAGLAGLYTALLLDKGLSCAIIIKNPSLECNSKLAQGGIASVVDTKNDTFELHHQDTLKVGGALVDGSLSRFMIEQGPREIANLMELGVAFDSNSDGTLRVTKEGGHNQRRVLHCGGDATGKLLMAKLTERVKAKPNIELLENHFLVDILTNGNDEVNGVIVSAGNFRLITARAVVVCSGGIGQVYRHTTNGEGSTGDGIAAALRAGAALRHMEFVQFHPTAFYNVHAPKSFFLISEALRGEGAILRNHLGEAFMQGRHPMADLAPRDIVSREIFLEMQQHKISNVYLDITHKDRDYLSQRFPTIFSMCLDNGIDMSECMIPVVPVQHYMMGGIQTDRFAGTNIVGLYACGEAACTGVHGANRLASNSLLECLVFARQCAEHINLRESRNDPPALLIEEQKEGLALNVQETAVLIKETMHQYGGILRNALGLQNALSTMDSIVQKLEENVMIEPGEIEVYNMALVSRQILKAGLARKDCMGAHFREDMQT